MLEKLLETGHTITYHGSRGFEKEFVCQGVVMDFAESLHEFVFTEHALFEIGRRDLDIEMVKHVISKPQQAFEVRPGRWVFQAVIEEDKGKELLLRVFVDIDRRPAEVVTAYKTSKIRKYWR